MVNLKIIYTIILGILSLLAQVKYITFKQYVTVVLVASFYVLGVKI